MNGQNEIFTKIYNKHEGKRNVGRTRLRWF